MSKNIWSYLLAGATRLRQQRFIRQTRQPEATQQQFLLQLLNDFQNTETGQRYQFEQIRTLDQFRQKVPVSIYKDYEADTERMLHGEQGILTPEPPLAFCFTSGTTSRQKMIAMPRKARSLRDAAKFISSAFMLQAAVKQGIPINKLLLTTSLQIHGRTSRGIPYGPLGAIDLMNTMFWQHRIFAQPMDALRIKQSRARNYVCLLFALQYRKLNTIGANFPVIAVGLAKSLEQEAQHLIHDLRSSTINPELEINAKLRATLEKQLKPAPKAADELQTILDQQGRLTPALAWPCLRYLITAQGVPSEFYAPQIKEYYGDIDIFGGTYASAEAVYGIYPELNSDASVLAINTNFYEFIPEAELDEIYPQVLLAHQLKEGQRYNILISNYAGLFRYNAGDIVEVTGFYNQTPRIKFIRRLGGVVCSTVEKTTDYHIAQTMEQVAARCSIPLVNFCVTLTDDCFPPAYAFNIELQADASPHTDLPGLLTEFEQALQNANQTYKMERQHAIPPPRLRVLAAGSFERLKQKLMDGGMPEYQLKILNLTDRRNYLDGLSVEQELHYQMDTESYVSNN